MQPFAAMIFAGMLVLPAEHWDLAGEEHRTKYFVNSAIELASPGGGKAVQIQSRIVFPSGSTVLTLRYWRRRNDGWEAATKTIDSFAADGRPESHQAWDDANLVWTATEPPKAKAWTLLLDKAAALLQGTRP